jgi:hypothetical protein
MKVTGFTFIRNAIIYDYPVVEAIRSILPLCDEVVVAVGRSDDATLELVQQIDPEKIRIIPTIWDDSLREGGRVLALETDKAFGSISKDTDWAFYIQGDELVHEKYLHNIYEGMKKWKDHTEVDGLLFNYLHFYGSYDYVAGSPRWYSKEIRVIRNNPSIYSYRDAQGFRKGNNEKLRVKPIDAWIYHYGWVKYPKAMQRKQENFSKLWHDDAWAGKNLAKAEEFDYTNIDYLLPFKGTHPKWIQERISQKNWKFDYDISRNRLPLRYKAKLFLRKYMGMDFDYRNYVII